MRKCVITGEETVSKRRDIPLSKEGRALISKVTNLHNEKIADLFVENALKKQEDQVLDENFLRSLSPKMTDIQTLRLLFKEESDIINTRNEVLNSEVG
jgi:uncharacterized protein (DUF1778 family)